MREAPRHKATLIVGVILFGASPFVFFLSPEIIFQPLLCTPEDAYELFACAGKIYSASFLLSTVTFIVGDSLGAAYKLPYEIIQNIVARYNACGLSIFEYLMQPTIDKK